MSQSRWAVLWAAVIAVLLLALLSVYGAFLGPDRAQAFFNSLPLEVYWFALAALLVSGIALFRRLLQVPSLLLMHFGCILVLAGGVWGSGAGHTVQKQLFGVARLPKGRMALRDGAEDNRITVADGNEIRVLPFLVRLKDFRMEYYDPGSLIIRSSDGRTWRLPATPGARLSLGDGRGTITVQSRFANFKLRQEDGRQVPYDAPGGSNPALLVSIVRPDGTSTQGYVFEQFPPVFSSPTELDLAYRRMVRDYISELEIVKDGKIVAAKDVEVNHPLHYGGYHFYQSDYGEDRAGQYSVLMVVSDAGLDLVYGGYVMLIAGVFWHFYGRRTVLAIKSRRRTASAEAGKQLE
jgi:hypothetical protein